MPELSILFAGMEAESLPIQPAAARCRARSASSSSFMVGHRHTSTLTSKVKHSKEAEPWGRRWQCGKAV